MPVAVQILPETVTLPHKQWTRQECLALGQAGVVNLERYELIEGELIRKMGKNHQHIRALRLLMLWLEEVFGGDYCLQEGSIDLLPEDNPTSEPEPDAVVLSRRFLELSALPRPEELRLVAEVSSSTLYYDSITKARLYSRSGIAEYWVLDLEGRRLLVHRDPRDGNYSSVNAYCENESVAPLAAPGSPVRVGEFLK
ncbi:MAG: Uma2 family endonuclease [Bryobacteraceae bacterium]|nr:Uma2 family endonuclease [Bryobacteraceae bacterium]